MASDIFRILVQSELSILPVTCTQMIAYTEFVSRQCKSLVLYIRWSKLYERDFTIKRFKKKILPSNLIKEMYNLLTILLHLNTLKCNFAFMTSFPYSLVLIHTYLYRFLIHWFICMKIVAKR